MAVEIIQLLPQVAVAEDILVAVAEHHRQDSMVAVAVLAQAL